MMIQRKRSREIYIILDENRSLNTPKKLCKTRQISLWEIHLMNRSSKVFVKHEFQWKKILVGIMNHLAKNYRNHEYQDSNDSASTPETEWLTLWRWLPHRLLTTFYIQDFAHTKGHIPFDCCCFLLLISLLYKLFALNTCVFYSGELFIPVSGRPRRQWQRNKRDAFDEQMTGDWRLAFALLSRKLWYIWLAFFSI